MSKKKTNFEEHKRNSILSEIGDWCFLSAKGDYMEITEWTNGEGVDINIYSSGKEQMFNMTWGQYDLFKKMMKQIIKINL